MVKVHVNYQDISIDIVDVKRSSEDILAEAVAYIKILSEIPKQKSECQEQDTLYQ